MRGDTGEFMVADIRGWGHLQYLPDGDKIQDANGKLMAAAPDLLKELMESNALLMDRIRDFSNSNPYQKQFIRRVESNTKAIKKATE